MRSTLYAQDGIASANKGMTTKKKTGFQKEISGKGN